MKKQLTKLLALMLALFCFCGTAAPALAAYEGTASGQVTAQLVNSKSKKKKSSKKKNSDKDVWIAPDHGKKYHKKSCRTLKKTKNKKKMKLSKAKKAGYKRCKVCKP